MEMNKRFSVTPPPDVPHPIFLVKCDVTWVKFHCTNTAQRKGKDVFLKRDLFRS